MNIPRENELRIELDQNGWIIIEENDDGLEWYAEKYWIIKSSWSPNSIKLYLTFLIDPMIHHERKEGEGVWAVGTSINKPQDRAEAEGKPLVVLNKNWRQSIKNFAQELNVFRLKS